MGTRRVGSAEEGYFWRKGRFTPIATPTDFPGSLGSAATGLNKKDDIVGFYIIGGVIHGFLKTGKVISTFDVPFAEVTSTFPLDINGKNEIVGYYTTATGVESFVYSPVSGFSKFRVPDAEVTVALTTNDRSQVAGYYVDFDGRINGFVATPVSTRVAKR